MERISIAMSVHGVSFLPAFLFAAIEAIAIGHADSTKRIPNNPALKQPSLGQVTVGSPSLVGQANNDPNCSGE